MEPYSRLRLIREERGFTENDIAILLGVSPQRIRLYETGEKKMKLHEYAEIAKFYNLSLDYIAGLIDAPLPLF